MTKLIVNADDFGYSRGVNLGIIDAFQKGILTSATMMANMPGAGDAAALAKENPDLGVGIHFVLTCGRPLTDAPSLVDEAGSFGRKGEYLVQAADEEIRRELAAQMEAFCSYGMNPTHIDSHHHVHSHERVYSAVRELALKYQLPVRRIRPGPQIPGEQDLKMTDGFIHAFFGEGLTSEGLLELIDQAAIYECCELMCHPAYLDAALLEGSSYALERVRELAILTDPAVMDYLKQKDIQLISYKNLF